MLALAERRLGAARDGQGGLLLLSGEAGIGKTRLLKSLQDLAGQQGFALWSAGAFPQDVELSAGLLLDLGHAMSRSGRPDVAERGQDLVTELAGGGMDLVKSTGLKPDEFARLQQSVVTLRDNLINATAGKE